MKTRNGFAPNTNAYRILSYLLQERLPINLANIETAIVNAAWEPLNVASLPYSDRFRAIHYAAALTRMPFIHGNSKRVLTRELRRTFFAFLLDE